MVDTPDGHDDGQPLSERFLDLFVFLPTGLAVAVAEELPRLAERGRERLGVQVNSARAIGQFAVKAGHHEFRRRSEGLRRSSPATGPATAHGTSTPTHAASAPHATPADGPPRLRAIPRPPARDTAPAAVDASDPSSAPSRTTAPVTAPESAPAAPAAPAAADRPAPSSHVPDVATLAIPGFDTLSASQVVQRLDGLSRSELVAVRAYETAGRGRRTILSRVDQLLDERS